MKKIAIIVTMLLTISTFAQVNPSQPTQNSENAAHKRNNQAVQGPVGTATALLVTLGAGAVAYKVRKGKKVEE